MNLMRHCEVGFSIESNGEFELEDMDRLKEVQEQLKALLTLKQNSPKVIFKILFAECHGKVQRFGGLLCHLEVLGPLLYEYKNRCIRIEVMLGADGRYFHYGKWQDITDMWDGTCEELMTRVGSWTQHLGKPALNFLDESSISGSLSHCSLRVQHRSRGNNSSRCHGLRR